MIIEISGINKVIGSKKSLIMSPYVLIKDKYLHC